MKKLIQVAKYLLFLGIGVFLFYSAYGEVNMDDLVSTLGGANYSWILLAIVAAIASHVSRAMRWLMLIKPLGYSPGLLNSFNAVMVGYLANLALPRMGEVSRCVILNRSSQVPVNQLFGTVVTERLIDLISLVALTGIAIIFEFQTISGYIIGLFSDKIEDVFSLRNGLILAGLFALLIGIWFILRKTSFYGKIRQLIMGFVDGFKTILQMENKWAFFAHSIFIWIMYYLMTYLSFFALEGTSHLTPLAGLVVFVMGSIGFIAPVQGGTGTYHYMFVQGLLFYNIDPEAFGKPLALLSHASNTLLMLVLGIISYGIFSILQNRKKRAASVARS